MFSSTKPNILASNQSFQRMADAASEFKKFFDLYIRVLLLNCGLIRGQASPCNFVILGRSRTGSNFLRGLLNSHRNILALGEIFRGRNDVCWDIPCYPKTASMISLIESDPVAFLQRYVFGKWPDKISAVGFKMFYFYAQDEDRLLVWDYLEGQKDLKIIHLTRTNMLRTLLSVRRANLNQKWVNTSGTTEPMQPVRLDYDECIGFFRKTREWELEYDRRFKDHPKVDLTYEELSSDRANNLKRLQEFLDVEIHHLLPSTYKQTTIPLLDAICNYSELKERFENSEWIDFFEE